MNVRGAAGRSGAAGRAAQRRACAPLLTSSAAKNGSKTAPRSRSKGSRAGDQRGWWAARGSNPEPMDFRAVLLANCHHMRSTGMTCKFCYRERW
jgi:hypothetical protein